MKKRMCKLVAGICSAALLIQLPMGALAEETHLILDNPPPAAEEIMTPEEPLQLDQDLAEALDAESEPVLLGEVPELREENVKYFRRADGAYVASMYQEPVHYTENGEWKDIDNTLVSNKAGYFQNKDNDFKVSMPSSASAWSPVRLSYEGHNISFRLEGSRTVQAQLTQPEESRLPALMGQVQELADAQVQAKGLKASAANAPLLNASAVTTKEAAEARAELVEQINKEQQILKKLLSRASYTELLPGVDVTYDLQGKTLKESLILNRLPEQESFSFFLNTGNLTPVLLEDGSVELRDGDSVVFTIAAPYMFDSAEEYCDNIGVTLTPAEGGVTYTIIPSRDWLEAEERVYPVTVDPTIIADCNWDTVKDTTAVYADSVPAGFNEKRYSYVGRKQGIEAVTLIYIDLPKQLTKSSRLVDAQLRVQYRQESYNPNSVDLQINAYQIMTDWNTVEIPDNRIITESDMPDPSDIALDYILSNDRENHINGDEVEFQPYTFDITKAAQSWMSKGSNFGIMLKGVNIPASNRWAQFINSDYRDETDMPAEERFCPTFVFTYRDTKGAESYWTHHDQSVGRAGTGMINDYSGRLVFQHLDGATSGNVMPTSVSHIYNALQAGEEYLPGFGGVEAYPRTGLGWKLNVQQTMYKIPASDPLYTTGYRYIYTDADGTEHYFYLNDDNEMVDEDGLDLTLTETGGWQNGPKMTFRDGSYMTFSADGRGYLVETFNTSGDRMRYLHGYNGRPYIGDIVDGANKHISMSIDSDGYLTKLTDSAGRVTTYTYNKSSGLNRLLTMITYPDGTKTKYAYDSLNRLTTVYNLYASDTSYGGKMVYSYDSKGRVTSVQEYGQNGASGQKMGIDYIDYNTTAFRSAGADDVYGNGDDLIDTYIFNTFGQTVTTSSETADGSEYFGGTYTNMSNSATTAKKIDLQPNRLMEAASSNKTTINLVNNPGFQKNVNGYNTFINKSGQSYTTSYDGSMGYITKGSVKISQTNTNPGVVWKNQDFEGLTPGMYTASVYFHTAGKELTNGSGASLNLEVVNISTDTVVRRSQAPGIQSTGAEEWVRASCSIQVNDGERLRIFMGYRDATVGDLWIDDLQVEAGETASLYNILENGGFERDTFDPWQVNAGSERVTRTRYTKDGSRGVWMDGAPSKPTGMKQRIELGPNASKQDTYVASLLGKGNGVNHADSHFGITIDICYSSDSTHKVTASFDHYSEQWQYLTFAFNLDDGKKETGQPIYIDFYIDYTNQENDAQLDDAQLVRDNYPSYDYDKNGNLKSVTDIEREQQFSAEGDGDITKVVDPKGNFSYYDYTVAKNHLVGARTESGMQYTFGNDPHGNVTSATVQGNPRLTGVVIDTDVYIRNKKNGKVLCAGADAGIFPYPNERNADQHWQIRVTPGYYHLFNPYLYDHYQKGYINADSAGTMTMDTYGSASQMTIEVTGGGQFRFRHVNTGKYLTYQEEGNRILLEASDTSDEGQYWYVERRVPTDSKKLETSAVYTPDGAFIDTVTDQRGIVTKYDYNQQKGLLNSVTTNYGAADSRTVNYTYDPDNDLLTKVSQGTAANEYLYDSLNRLIGIKHNGFQYNFGYDAFGNRTTTKVGTRPLSENTYNPNNGKLTKTTYGNGAQLSFQYDKLDRVTEKWWNGSKAFTWTYNNAGQVGRHEDLVNNEVYTYNYDTIGRLMDWRDSRGYGSSYAYDLNNNPTKWKYSAFGQTVTQSNTYGKDDLLKQSSAGGYVWTYSYDSLNRLTSKNLGPRTYEYTYVDAGDNKTTSLLSGLSVDGLVSYGYTYDAFGNIKTISENGTLKVTYTYDEWNQLIKEVHNGGDTIEYTYDRGGNRLSKKVNGTWTQQIICENRTWRDAMTDFNGRSIGYDTIGNIVSYYNGSSYSFTWEKGRQLSTLQKGDTSVSYSYNADGLRTSKTVNGTKTSYVWDGSALLGQQGGGKTLIFLYDATGLYGFRYNGTTYFYLYNGQGDVVGLINTSGTQVVSYTYDAWGKPLTTTGSLASTIGEINPIRYRGYYYDAESGLYYLQSRYYDPVVGRFINADGVLGANGDLVSYNLFAYCSNNPVNYSDPTGNYYIGNVTGKRYDYIGCVTRAEIERYEGGMQNITYYPDDEDDTIYWFLGPLGSICYKVDGWKIRIDTQNTNTYTQRHIHLEHGSVSYAQNNDGSPHDGSTGSPPKKLLKKLKEMGIWDWDSKAQSWNDSKKIVGEVGMALPSISEDAFLRLVYRTDSPNVYILPQMNPTGFIGPIQLPTFIPSPVPVFLY